MATQEKKLEIWKALSRQTGCPPKDTEEYFQKTEAYYHILEELNSQETAHDQPPSQRAPVAHIRKARSLRDDPDVRELEMQPRHHVQRGVCYCDCHRTGGRGVEPARRKVIRCDTSSSDSDSDDSYQSRAPRPSPKLKEKLKGKEKEKELQEKRPRGRPRRVVEDSDSESAASESEEEEKPKRKVVPPAKKKLEPKKSTKKSSTKRASR